MVDTAITQPSIQEIIHSLGSKANNLLQILCEVQHRYNFISDSAVDSIAQEINLPRARVEGVVHFYGFLHKVPRGQYDILLSDNIIDHLQGKEELMHYLLEKLKVERGKPRADGCVTVDNTSCIGMSDQGPAALVNGYTVTHLSRTRIDTMVDLIESQTPLSDWPRKFFQVENNIRRKQFLLKEGFEPGTALKIMFSNRGLKRAGDAILAQLSLSGLRGCGGAGFKTDSKWKICRDTQSDEHYVICNADEGEPGTFKDRVLLQSYPDLVFEGMTLCAAVIGAHKGFLYLRGEYRYLLDSLEAVLTRRREEGLLGKHILGKRDFSFDIEIHLGAGAYICGAETALIESLEGHRGVPRKKPPPFPVVQGYLNKPTVVNNVETLALATRIMLMGGERFAAVGTSESKGTKLMSISGDCDNPGVYEFAFGTTVREVLDACGAHQPQAVQNSGPAGTCVSEAEFDRKLCFEDLNTTGSFMIFDRTRDLLEMVRNFAQFFVHESCGFCTPCRVGTTLLKTLVEKVYQGHGTINDLKEMEQLSHIIKTSSHCGLGMTAANHVTDTLKKFSHLYERRLVRGDSLAPVFDLDAALESARQITQRTDKNAHL
jgi:[NiFe] hydrogenase diaphorase moiety large subunit